tara:strand:+ start:2771 stop:3055 length:285 start_codon:yes stop_codon:yes gene_type:complete
MDKELDKLHKEMVDLKKDLSKVYTRISKQVTELGRNLKKNQIKIDEVLDRVRSFDIVLTEYVDGDVEEEEDSEDWNPYEIDPEDYHDPYDEQDS